METRLLIVEDDLYLQEGLRELHQGEGYCAACAGK